MDVGELIGHGLYTGSRLDYRLRQMSHLQFSHAILSREYATKSCDKIACAATVQLHAATLSPKHGLNKVFFV